MKARKTLLALLLLLSLTPLAKADKGMWILSELKKQNIERMRELGFNLPIDSLYSLDKPSVANAVVIFGNGCTGITVSEQGLVFTNHHCGFPNIQSLSSVEHDYLRDGFVSHSMGEELPAPGLKVRYLRQVENITERVVSQLTGITDEVERIQKANEVGNTIAQEASTDDHQEAEVIPFYSNNEYFLIVYDVYTDVRLVFTPPSSVGKFGGDTDNWMWPRQTGDFSVFRVYAGADNRPADYNPANKPYKPVYYARVSMDGYKPGDYAMTIGFPGSTDRYLTSWGVQDRMKNENDPRIEVRGIKQAIWKEAMQADQATRIKYASKYAQSANYWKNSIGMNKALVELDVIANKQKEEQAFAKWASLSANSATYGSVLTDLQKAYAEGAVYNRDMNYMYETLFGGTEIIRIAQYAQAALNGGSENAPKILEHMQGRFYKDYIPTLDQKVLAAMLKLMIERLPKEYHPDVVSVINKKFKGDTDRYAQWIFAQSVVPYPDKLEAATKLNEKKIKQILEKDPAILLAQSVVKSATALQERMMKTQSTIERGKRLYFAGRRAMSPDELLTSDANFTMRMSYGSVAGYSPRDAEWYEYYTTQRGVLEKQDPSSDEFFVQPEILKLMQEKDFGSYAENGNMNLCFLSTNDITGGNSGSPVFDKNGRLIGLAFDGNWEAMSGDIEFDPNLQRTINVDVRYMLFMMDKWGKCRRLIDELTILKTPPAQVDLSPAVTAQKVSTAKMSKKSTAAKKGGKTAKQVTCERRCL